MESIDLLPIPPDKRERIVKFAEQYSRFANIHFKVLEADKDAATIRVAQHFKQDRKYLDQKALIDRTKELFDGEVPEGYKIHVRAIPYKENEMDVVDVDWVKSRMQEYDLRPVDMVNLLGIDRQTFNKLMNETVKLTRIHRAAFFYLFKTLKKGR